MGISGSITILTSLPYFTLLEGHRSSSLVPIAGHPQVAWNIRRDSIGHLDHDIFDGHLAASLL